MYELTRGRERSPTLQLLLEYPHIEHRLWNEKKKKKKREKVKDKFEPLQIIPKH